jgi:hypothetical protein
MNTNYRNNKSRSIVGWILSQSSERIEFSFEEVVDHIVWPDKQAL